jgi:hypothetical protein
MNVSKSNTVNKMKNVICILFLSISFATCKKDSVNHTEHYVKQVIYSETFDTDPSWTLLPKEEAYHPDTNCIKVEDGQMKMLFDQPLNSCGCAWVGVEHKQENTLVNGFLNKIGIKLILKEGYFQWLSRAFDTIDGPGAIISSSTFQLSFNSIDVRFPRTLTRFHRDSVIDFNTKDKLIGKEFEIIYDNGNKTLKIDGIEQPIENVWLNWQNMWNIPLSIEFNLGHLPELSPRMDKLFVDEIEIYTWTGELK